MGPTGGRLVRASAWLFLVVLVATYGGGPALADHDPFPEIDYVFLINPGSDEVWLAGSDHDVSCTTVTDQDCNLETGVLDPDGVTHWWPGSSGKFVDDDNIGTEVGYICRTDAGTDTVMVQADDEYPPEDGSEDPCLANDLIVPRSASRGVTVAKSWVEALDFKSTNNFAMKDDSDDPVEIDLEYDESEDINEPACQEMNASVTAEVKFGDTGDFTESSNVCVSSQDGTVDFEESGTWALAVWESEGDELTSTPTLNEVRKYDGNSNTTTRDFAGQVARETRKTR